MSKLNWTQFDNFVLSDIIHQSDVGSCYLARNLNSNSDAVVTVLQVRDPRAIDVELAAITSVSHPAVFRPTTVGQTPEGNVYVATSHFGSALLADTTKDDLFEDPVVALEFIKEIATGLATAAKQGILHQNVTPDHIWVRPSDKDQGRYAPLIVDWGVPYLGNNQLRPQYIYSAPEQEENQYVDEPALIYALGVLTYELLARGHPSEYGWLVAGTTALRPMPPNLRELRTNLADATYDFVQTSIRTQSWARYGTFAEYLAALDVAIAAEGSRSGRAFLPVSRSNGGEGRRGRVVLGAVALLAIIAAILWVMFAWLPGQDSSAVAQSTTPSATATVVQLETLGNISISAETLTPDDPVMITWQWDEPLDGAEFNVYLTGEETTRLPGSVNLAEDGDYTFDGVLPDMTAGDYTVLLRLETIPAGDLVAESDPVPLKITGSPTEAMPTPSNTPEPTATAVTIAAAADDETPTATPTATATPTLEPTPTPEPTEPLVPAVRVVTLAANIRGGPGLPFDIIGGLRQGAVVEVIATDEGRFWYLIRLVDGRTGWVAASVVEPAWDGAVSGLPVADNIPSLPTRTPTFIPPTLPPVSVPTATEPAQNPPTPTTAPPPTPIPVPPTPTPPSPT